MKKSGFFSIVFVVAISLCACYNPGPDPVNPKLIKYTEKGLNIASALVDNQDVWTSKPTYYTHASNPNHPSITSDTTNNRLSVAFFGLINEKVHSHIYFSLTGFDISQLQDLVKLREKKIAFDGINQFAQIRLPQSDITFLAETGQIYFKKVIINDSVAIISGGFGFNSKSGKTSYTYGRFDYSVKNSNFTVK